MRSLMRRGRTGGMLTQLVFATLHAGTHVAAAIFSVVLLELGVETCIRCDTNLAGKAKSTLLDFSSRRQNLGRLVVITTHGCLGAPCLGGIRRSSAP